MSRPATGKWPPAWSLALATILWWLGIVLLIPNGRVMVDALRSRNLLVVSVSLGLALIALVSLGFVVMLWRVGKLRWKQVAVAAGAILALLCLAQLLERHEERWHVVQYGVLTALCWSASRLGGFWRTGFALSVGALCGWLDEGVQYLLPERVYDNWDVLLNAVSGAAGVGVMELSARFGVRASGVPETRVREAHQ